MSSGEIIGALGRGKFAVVILAKLHFHQYHDTTLVAIKLSENSSVIKHERSILHHLTGCPQIIQPIHDQNNAPNHLYLEYAPHGSLRSLLSSSGPLPLPQVRAYTASILKGLVHVHKNRYVHCDIKPDNILVWTETDIKIADFGLAKRTGEKAKGMTPMYMAPECATRGEYEAPMDIWSLGCTVAEMITGRMAMRFDAFNGKKGITRKLVHDIGEGTAYPEIPEGLSEAGKDFLSKCFAREPERRWSAEMLLNHRFLEGYGGGNARRSADDRSTISDAELQAAMESYYEYTAELLGI